MKLCFDEELLEILTPEDVIYLSILIHSDDGVGDFYTTEVYEKLLEFYIDEIPYGTLRYKTGEADWWIVDKLVERIAGSL